MGCILRMTGPRPHAALHRVIGWTMLIFGIVLYWADQKAAAGQDAAEGWTLRDAVIMGLWQAVALIPGTSRSGITITGAPLPGL